MNNYKRVTFSIPKITYLKLEISIPKNKRSKFVAEAVEKKLSTKQIVTYEEVSKLWDDLAKKFPNRSKKTAVELIREDRASH